ncbi:hypothetical protein EWM64_g1563 [Hericium alpestre]|uniref:Uncharacterized protein n=1 Tax=Hericium alpestre TaxID=135208 RepID=A0A4Z0AAA9_9AGAM|nr:hypothetical protein EWM64_g1563 [Hericium alpestre]
MLCSWLRRLYWHQDAFQSTTDFQHIKSGYYWSESIARLVPVYGPEPGQTDSYAAQNPTRIVPIGPVPHIEPL